MLYVLEPHEKPSETFCLVLRTARKMIDKVPLGLKK